MQCVFSFRYVLNINNRRYVKLLFDSHSTINCVSALAKLQSEYKFLYVCLSVSPFVRLSYHMELGSSGRFLTNIYIYIFIYIFMYVRFNKYN